MRKIAVVGGGIFGVTSAWHLAKHGFEVDLFEKERDILCAASGINQYRLHRGYHYPRSESTARQSMREFPNFVKHYGEAVVPAEHYYCIAKENSLTSPARCRKVWKECGLEFEEAELPFLKRERIAWTVRVREALLDLAMLRSLCRKKLERWGVSVHLGREVGVGDLASYGLVVVATYAHNNRLLQEGPEARREYQFELCEKPVLSLPPVFRNKSVVILDGPFLCIDPMARTDRFVMGNVVHAIHHVHCGEAPEIPPAFRTLLNRGIVANPTPTHIEKFLKSASDYFAHLEGARHLGSMFTLRAVLPRREHDDARPTLVEEVSDRCVTVFSGKIGTCVRAAERVLEIAERKLGRSRSWSKSA